jgi:hypothetical protein
MSVTGTWKIVSAYRMPLNSTLTKKVVVLNRVRVILRHEEPLSATLRVILVEYPVGWRLPFGEVGQFAWLLLVVQLVHAIETGSPPSPLASLYRQFFVW